MAMKPPCPAMTLSSNRYPERYPYNGLEALVTQVSCPRHVSQGMVVAR